MKCNMLTGLRRWVGIIRRALPHIQKQKEQGLGELPTRNYLSNSAEICHFVNDFFKHSKYGNSIFYYDIDDED